MKEVTYEDWQKNPSPKMMWVWDGKEDDKEKRKVLYITGEKVRFPVIAMTDEKDWVEYKHCAEIEKQRRMTHKELARWLREKPTRESKCANDNYIYSVHAYKENCGDEEVNKNIVIREDDGEWREPNIVEE